MLDKIYMLSSTDEIFVIVSCHYAVPVDRKYQYHKRERGYSGTFLTSDSSCATQREKEPLKRELRIMSTNRSPSISENDYVNITIRESIESIMSRLLLILTTVVILCPASHRSIQIISSHPQTSTIVPEGKRFQMIFPLKLI